MIGTVGKQRHRHRGRGELIRNSVAIAPVGAATMGAATIIATTTAFDGRDSDRFNPGS